MTSRQLLLLSKEKQLQEQKYNHLQNKKTKNGKNDTPKVLEDEHERFVKYVDTDYDTFKGKPPVTDYEMREHIKKSFRKRRDLHFLIEESNDSSYDNLIADIQATESYNRAVAEQKRWITLKKKSKYGNKQRTGTPINDKYYYVIIKAHRNKNGQRISASRKYYSSYNGKPIAKGKISKYIETRPQPTIELTRIDRIKTMRKKEKPLFEKLNEKKKAQQRIKRLRGRK